MTNKAIVKEKRQVDLEEPTLVIFGKDDEIQTEPDKKNGKPVRVEAGEIKDKKSDRYWTQKVKELNDILAELERKPEHLKLYFDNNDVGSILNAYKEGDISSDRAKELLSIREYKQVAIELADKYVKVSFGKLIFWFFDGKVVAMKAPKETAIFIDTIDKIESEKIAGNKAGVYLDKEHFEVEISRVMIEHSLL